MASKFNLSTVDGINGAISSIARRGVSLKSFVGEVAVHIMAALDTGGALTGNWGSSVVPLCHAVDKAFGSNYGRAIRAYFVEFTWLEMNPNYKKGSDLAHERHEFRKNQDKKIDVAGAKEACWYEVKAPKGDPEFNPSKTVENAFKRAGKAGATAELIEALEAAIAKAKAELAKELADTNATVNEALQSGK